MFEKENIDLYSKKYNYVFVEKKAKMIIICPNSKRLFDELSTKLKNFSINQNMDAIMKFSLDEILETSIFLNFDKRN